MMEATSNDTSELIAGRNGWSLAKAEGYLHGVTLRKSGQPPSNYLQVGIDEYSRGFRAGYYERQDSDGSIKSSTGSVAREPVVRLTPVVPGDSISVDATIVSGLGG